MSVASYLGRTPIRLSIGSIQGRLVAINSEPFYRIENYDRMRPFLMSLVSESDHWMFISSNGGLTSGRGNPDKAVFPYDTEDKIQDAVETTGPKTLLWVDRGTRRYLWEPFSLRGRGLYRVRGG